MILQQFYLWERKYFFSPMNLLLLFHFPFVAQAFNWVSKKVNLTSHNLLDMILSIKMWLRKVLFSDVEQSLLNQRNFKWLREWHWIPLLWLLIDELLYQALKLAINYYGRGGRNQATQEVGVGKYRENLNLEKLVFFFFFGLFLNKWIPINFG